MNIDNNKQENKEKQGEQSTLKKKGMNELEALELDTKFMSNRTRSRGGYLAINDQ